MKLTRSARLTFLAPTAVLACAVIAIALVWLGLTLEIRRDEDKSLAAATSQVESVAQALLEHVERTLSGIDIASLYLRHAWIDDRTRFAELATALQPASVDGVIVSVTVLDAAGRGVFSTVPTPPEPVDFSDREHFRVHRDNPGDELFIGKPVMERLSKQVMIQVTRKIVTPTGEFGGVLVIAIAPHDIIRIHDHLELGPHGRTSVIGLDRVVRASVSPSNDPIPEVAREVPADRPFFAMPRGTFEAPSSRDGEQRRFAFRRLSRFPLVVVASMALSDLRDTSAAHRREQVTVTAAATIGIVFYSVTVAGLFIQLGRRNRDVEHARRRSDLLLASAGEGICGVDPNGRVTFMNPAARRMLGWSDLDGIGTPLHRATHHTRADGSPYPECDCPTLHTLQDGIPREIARELFWRRDGTSFPAEFTSTPIIVDGKVTGAVVVFRDITSSVATEQALVEKSDALARSNEELQQFAYVASHDLREPLRMVSSYVSLLERRLADKLDEDTRAFIGFARDGATRMDRLILDLLEYSRIGRQERPMAPVDLTETMADVSATLASAMADCGGRVDIAGPLPVVMGDRGELTRLLQNLVANALKYHDPDRAPVVVVGAEEDGEHWRIRVKDNGIGIACGHFDRIFGIFQRLHTRDQYEGTGIGLAVCKKIVQHHGGRIWVESEPGEGSTFFLTLPRAAPPAGTAPDSAA